VTGPVLEHAFFHVAPDDAPAFEAGFATARLVIGAAPGCRWVELHRGVERPETYLLLVEWDSLADHQTFRTSEAFPGWRAPIQPFFAADPQMEHFTSVVARTP
jgi:heme-degrading monooxygenase HmoA